MIREYVVGDLRHAIAVEAALGHVVATVEVSGDTLTELFLSVDLTGIPWASVSRTGGVTIFGIPVKPRADILPAWRLVAPDGSVLRESEW